MQPIDGSVAGKLAKEVLIAGGLAVVIILVVETGAAARSIISPAGARERNSTCQRHEVTRAELPSAQVPKP